MKSMFCILCNDYCLYGPDFHKSLCSDKCDLFCFAVNSGHCMDVVFSTQSPTSRLFKLRCRNKKSTSNLSNHFRLTFFFSCPLMGVEKLLKKWKEAFPKSLIEVKRKERS